MARAGLDPRAAGLVSAAAATAASPENPREDARRERLQATFDSEEVAAWLHDGADNLRRKCVAAGGGKAVVERRRARGLAPHPPPLPMARAPRNELVKLLAEQPWGDKSQRYFLNREEEYVGGLRAAIGIW